MTPDRSSTAERRELLGRLWTRVEKWRATGGYARVTVPLRELQAAEDRVAALEAQMAALLTAADSLAEATNQGWIDDTINSARALLTGDTPHGK